MVWLKFGQRYLLCMQGKDCPLVFLKKELMTMKGKNKGKNNGKRQ